MHALLAEHRAEALERLPAALEVLQHLTLPRLCGFIKLVVPGSLFPKTPPLSDDDRCARLARHLPKMLFPDIFWNKDTDIVQVNC